MVLERAAAVAAIFTSLFSFSFSFGWYRAEGFSLFLNELKRIRGTTNVDNGGVRLVEIVWHGILSATWQHVVAPGFILYYHHRKA